jgi:hypothetical protein
VRLAALIVASFSYAAARAGRVGVRESVCVDCDVAVDQAACCADGGRVADGYRGDHAAVPQPEHREGGRPDRAPRDPVGRGGHVADGLDMQALAIRP